MCFCQTLEKNNTGQRGEHDLVASVRNMAIHTCAAVNCKSSSPEKQDIHEWCVALGNISTPENTAREKKIPIHEWCVGLGNIYTLENTATEKKIMKCKV